MDMLVTRGNRKIYRCLLHIPAGLAVVLFLLVHPLLSGLFFSGFMVYELNEDRHLKDQAYIDILGMLVGMAVAGAFWLAVIYL
jgi:hypothetical protein